MYKRGSIQRGSVNGGEVYRKGSVQEGECTRGGVGRVNGGGVYRKERGVYRRNVYRKGSGMYRRCVQRRSEQERVNVCTEEYREVVECVGPPLRLVSVHHLLNEIL